MTWDPLCSFSCYHGATTVIISNCSLALAPVTRWLADQPGVYFAARTIMAITAGATLFLVYVLGGRVGPGVGTAPRSGSSPRRSSP